MGDTLEDIQALESKISSLVTEFSKNLNDLLAHAGDLLKTDTQPVINCNTFTQRAKFLEHLKTVRKSIGECITQVNNAGESINKIHIAETNRAAELLGGKSQNISLVPVSYAGKAIKPSRVKAPVTQPFQTIPADMTFIKITAGAGIYAKQVEVPSDVKADGVIYYLRGADHFAVRLGPLFLHGNIGNIYDRTGEPQRIKYCRYGPKCLRPEICTYYHDPLETIGQRDCKNYTATSFMYSPTQDSRGCRRIGSRDRFDIDLAQLQPEDIRDFYDQVAHELFCAVVISQMQKT